MTDGAPHHRWVRSTRALLFVLAAAVLTTSSLRAMVALALAAGFLTAAGPWAARGWSRLLASAASVAWVVVAFLARPLEPSDGLWVLVGVVALLAHLWPPPPSPRDRFDGEHGAHLALASATAIVFGLDTWTEPPSVVVLIGWVALPLGPVLFAWSVRAWRRSWWRAVALGLATLAALVPWFASSQRWEGPVLSVGSVAPLIVLALVAHERLRGRFRLTDERGPSLLDFILVHPSRVLALSFLLICAIGTALLRLPAATASDTSLSWLDAAFTGVSATCVTGLIVVDTPVVFGPFGQAVILCLIQVGGLGIMAFSAAAILVLGRRLSLSHERAAVDLLGAQSRAGLGEALQKVLLVTIVVEATAAALLFVAFLMAGDSPGTASWRAVFTAISAFCNAGFALQSDSLVPYAQDPFVLSVVGVTIVLGGLGPPVVASLVTRSGPRRSLHVKLVLATTAVLLLLPLPMIGVLEWDGALAGLPLGDKLMNAAFQSITLRTAGFNSMDLSQLHPATWTVMVLMMFVGGSPGSTAGGVKTTSIAVVVLAVAAVIRGRADVELFGRRLPVGTVLRATAVVTVGVLACAGALMAVQLTQSLSLDVALFEVVSALATVGLSTGGTGALDEIGKLIIIGCMFAGRIGPLTIFVLLVSRTRAATGRQFPKEDVPIG